MNPLGAKRMQQYLPDAVVTPFSRIIRDNRTPVFVNPLGVIFSNIDNQRYST
jgi:hypothetical protein